MTVKKLKHLRVKKGMSFKEQFQVKWREQFRKNINYYEPIVKISNLFK